MPLSISTFVISMLVAALVFALWCRRIIRRAEPVARLNGSKVFTGLAAGVRDTAIRLGIVLYFVGFVYQFSYYRTLGINVNVIDLNPYTVLAYSQYPLRHEAQWIVWLVVVIAVPILWARELPAIALRRSAYLAIVAVGAFLTLNVLISISLKFGIATATVVIAQSGVNVDNNLVHFIFTTSSGIPPDLSNANDRCQLYVVEETVTEYFVVK